MKLTLAFLFDLDALPINCADAVIFSDLMVEDYWTNFPHILILLYRSS